MIEAALAAISSRPLPPRHLPKPFSFDSENYARLTHYLFRYPAKFHPPVARALVERYADGELVYDPFCGSGSVLVETLAAGQKGLGSDVDPVAVFISRVKTHPFNSTALRRSCGSCWDLLCKYIRDPSEYAIRQYDDITSAEMVETIRKERLFVPRIPNIEHWFRRYVILDLARIHRAIRMARVPESHREFLLLCFLAILREVSNADPVPVSGLEVTSHMKARDVLGRVVDPFYSLERAISDALAAVTELEAIRGPQATVAVFRSDATAIGSRRLPSIGAVITSPPYHNAVDYYRRHTLEMYWLGAVADQDDRLRLRAKYLGRHGAPKSHPFVAASEISTPLAMKWDSLIRSESPKRADDFKHFVVGMRLVFAGLARILSAGSRAVFVVGHSTWNGERIPTSTLFGELAAPEFDVTDQLWYPLPNRYMSYSRHNGASIDREHVLVLTRGRR